MAATDPTAYLRATAPFSALPAPLLAEASAGLDVAFHPAGTWLVRAGGTPLEHLYVIRKGAVRLERDGQTLQVLEEGEVFGYTSLLSRRAALDVQVEQDLVAYRIPAEVFRRLLADATFAAHFAEGLSERLKAALAQSPVASFRPDLSLDVRQVAREPAVWVEAGATVGEAARRMREARVTSVLVRGDPPALLTDRDLRNRVLAEGLGPDVTVGAVATRAPQTVDGGLRIHEAWTRLIEAGGHHLPVVEGGEWVGVLTATDLLRCTAQSPVAVLRRVERLASRERLPGYARTVTEMVSALVAGGLDATLIAGFVASLNDALLGRIVRMAEAELGPAPARWAWLALGSDGRREQTLLTDQDNALAWEGDGEGEGVRAWFEEFAARVGRDLRAAGFPDCPGGTMARRWLGPVGEWTGRFASWFDAPSPEAVLHGAIFLDFRRVAGDLSLAPLEAVLAQAPRKPAFLRFLARAAVEFHPPPAVVLRLASSTVDLKAHGIAPVVFLARCYGLELGGGRRGTLERVEAAAAAGLLSEEVYANVADAYRFLLGLRLRLQLRALAQGRPAADAVPLAELDAVERSRLKDALRAVRAFVDAGAHHFRTDF